MPTVFLQDTLRPKYFISYSRRDVHVLDSLRDNLEGALWYDTDQLVPGDDWMREISNGIHECDELILLVTDEALTRPVVRREVSIARSLQKPIRPIVLKALRSPLPEDLQTIHYLDLSHVDSAWQAESLRNFLASGDEIYDQLERRTFVTVWKRNACRGVWPMFAESMLSPNGQTTLFGILAIVEPLLSNYSPKSLLLMNSGLLKCLVGNWTDGLQALRAHAEASGSFPGWYMYALHLNQRRPLNSIEPGVGEEALRAISSAERFGVNPLCVLLRAIYELGYRNVHPSLLPTYMERIQQNQMGRPDLRTEYLRLFWCLGSSFGAFRQYQRDIVEMLKKLGDGQ